MRIYLLTTRCKRCVFCPVVLEYQQIRGHRSWFYGAAAAEGGQEDRNSKARTEDGEGCFEKCSIEVNSNGQRDKTLSARVSHQFTVGTATDDDGNIRRADALEKMTCRRRAKNPTASVADLFVGGFKAGIIAINSPDNTRKM